jgi:hypothetical protein
MLGHCCSCKKLIAFNPHKVPSTRVNGVLEPVCADCVGRLNEVRAKQGLAPWPILPDAYEPINENE